MLTLMPSIWVGLAGIALTAILLAADWYIWDFRYWTFGRRAVELAPIRAADGREVIHVPGAFGREVVVVLAPRSADRITLPLHRVEGEWMDDCA